MKTKIKTETMKLELKHLAPYLPYGLKRHCPSSNVIIHDYTAMEFTQETCDRHQSYGWKPILRPLSDLTKEIEYKGESVRSIDYISTTKANSQRIMRRVVNQQNLDCLEYWQFERLLSLHFDVFGLIEARLAIDINTIEPKL